MASVGCFSPRGWLYFLTPATRVPGLRWWGWEPSKPEGGKLSAEDC